MSFFSQKNIFTNACSMTLMLFIILGVIYILYARREGFLSSGNFPSIIDTGLLAPPYGDYKMFPKGPCAPGLSKQTYKNEWKLYPYTDMSSYAQVTNNKQYWSTPCNGTSTPPEVCGGLYQKKKIVRPAPVPPPPNYPQNAVRVNYYVSRI
jgi:hypothetical protein